MAATYASVEEYVASFPEDVREVLEQVRRRVLRVVPDAGEKISYQMPTITSGGKPVVHFAGWKSHLSLYPAPEGDEDLAADLAPYSAGKGTLKFPLDRPIPYELIERVARAALRGALRSERPQPRQPDVGRPRPDPSTASSGSTAGSEVRAGQPTAEQGQRLDEGLDAEESAAAGQQRTESRPERSRTPGRAAGPSWATRVQPEDQQRRCSMRSVPVRADGRATRAIATISAATARSPTAGRRRRSASQIKPYPRQRAADDHRGTAQGERLRGRAAGSSPAATRRASICTCGRRNARRGR